LRKEKIKSKALAAELLPRSIPSVRHPIITYLLWSNLMSRRKAGEKKKE